MLVRRILLCLAVGVLAAQAVSAETRLLHSQRSLYREVLVYENELERCMCFTRQCRIGRQSCIDMRHPDRMVMNYPKLMLGALFLNPTPRKVLIVGLGGGTIPRALTQILPDVQIDIVEIDPAVVEVARKYFLFAESDRVKVFEADGRVFVKRALREKRQYDLVMLDAFDHEYIPEHLLTREFLTEVKSLLGPNGVLAANTFSSSRLYHHESMTYAAVFPQFYNLKRENRVIIASAGPLPDMERIRSVSSQFTEALKPFGVDTQDVVASFSTRRDWNPRARVLTDQYSPANLLNAGE